MNIPTRKSLWDVFKQRLETANTTSQKVTQYNPLYQMTRGTLNIPKTMVQDIASIKKGTTYTPAPTNLPISEQIKWNEQQSKESQRAQLGIQRTLGGLQTGLQSFAPTAIGVSTASYIQKKRGVPSPLLKPEEIKIPTAGKVGINIAGGLASYITIGSAVGNFMKGSAYLAPLVRSYPKLARTAQFIATAGSIDQLKAPIDSLMSERSKIFAKSLPSYIGMGYGFATPTLRQAIPSAFIGQFLSSKLSGKDNQNAFKESLTSAAIISLLKIPSIYNRISVTKQLKTQARSILDVKPDASPKEITTKYYNMSHQYHPDVGGDPVKFKAVNEAYKVLSQPITQIEQSAWQELKSFYSYLKSDEGKSMALSIINEMPVGMSIKEVSPETPTPKPITNVLPISKELVGSTDEAGNVFQGISQSGKDYVVKYLLPRTGKILSIIKPTLDEALTYAKNLFVNPAPLKSEFIPITPIVPKATPAIPKALEPLAKEAMKYDSAEEFVKAVEDNKVIVPFSEGLEIEKWGGNRELHGTGTLRDTYKDFYTQAKGVGEVSKQLQQVGKDTLQFKDANEFEMPTINRATDEFIQLKSDIEQNGIQVPAILDIKTGKILDGQKRIAAVKELGIKNIPYIELDSSKISKEKLNTEIDKLTKLYTQATKGIKEVKPTEIPPAAQKGGVEAIQPTPNLIAQPTPKPLLQVPAQAPTIPLGGQTPTIPLGAPSLLRVENIGGISKERGYITSVKEIIPDLKVSGQYIPRSTDKLSTEAIQLINSDINEATKLAMTGTDDKAVAIASELIKHYGEEAAKATDKTVKNALYDKAAEITNDMAHKLTELGRSVQAASLLSRLTPEGQVRFATKEIQRYNARVEKSRGGLLGLRKKIPKLTPEQTQKILDEMKTIEQMPDGVDKAIRFQKLQNYIQDLVPSPLIDKAIALWKGGLLTGLRTSGLNIFSNISHAGTETLKDIPAKGIDSVISLFTKKQTIGLTLRGTRGILEGFNKGTRYLKTGFDERNVGAKLDWKRVNFGKGKIAKALQRYEETVFHIMGAEDQPFYYGAKARSLVDQAIAQANNQKIKGTERKVFIDNLIQNPTDEMVRYAVLDAEIAVYQNETALGLVARSIQKTKIGEFIVPFGRTPSAVATQIINYSPVGIPKTIIENIGNGRFDQRNFSQAMGRSIVGIIALYIGAKLFQAGRIALRRPRGEREQKLWEIEGKKPNAIYIGGECIDGVCSGGKWRSIITFGPNGNLLLVGGYFQEAYNETGSPTAALMASSIGGVESFTEQTFLTGMNQVVAALNDPERSAEGYFGSVLSSFIPTIAGDIAKAVDPYERRTETIMERMQAKVPFLRGGLEPKINILGEKMASIGNPLEIMIDPTRPSVGISSPLTIELRRLSNVGYQVSPTLLGNKEGYEGLTQRQNTLLWENTGTLLNTKLTKLINTPEYQGFSDEKKAKWIEGFVSKAKYITRIQMIVESIRDLQGQELKDKLKILKDSGLMTKTMFTDLIKAGTFSLQDLQ